MDPAFCALVSGATAGLSVDLGLYPLDTLKTRLQSQEGFQKAGGFRNVYRGMGSVALGSAPGSALFFLTYSSLHSYWRHESSWCDAARACCGEFTACLVRVPTEVVKQNAQVSSEQSAFKIAADLWGKGGIRAFYRGFFTTLAREIPFAFIEYPLWEYLKRRLAKNDKKVSPIQSAFCGSLAGVVAAGLTTPLDVAKTRIMLSSHQLSTIPVLIQIAQTNGFRALFSGLGPRCAWMGVGGCIYFFAYEQTMHNMLNVPPVCRFMLRSFLTSRTWLTRLSGRVFSTAESGIDVTFKTANGEFTVKGVPVGDSVLDVVINNDVPIEGYGACEGTLACSTCHVILEPDHFERCGKISENELDVLDYAAQLHDRSRLGCQVHLTEADKPSITLTVPSERRDARTI